MSYVLGQHSSVPWTSNFEMKTFTSLPFKPLNITDGKFIWEGGSFPFDETQDSDNDSAFYDRAVIIAPIVGSIFIVFLVVIGIYSLRKYDVPETPRGKDVESLCEHCSRTRAEGIRFKIQHYVMRIFDVKQDAFLIRMDPRSRTLNRGEFKEARETLV